MDGRPISSDRHTDDRSVPDRSPEKDGLYTNFAIDLLYGGTGMRRSRSHSLQLVLRHLLLHHSHCYLPLPLSLATFPPLSATSLLFPCSLSSNSLSALLPSSSLLPCPSLLRLDLSFNLFAGILPYSLSYLPHLLHLDLIRNNFFGSISATFAYFPRLKTFSLVDKLLSGTMPSFRFNLTTLSRLNLSYNPFAPRIIPATFGNLTALETLWLADCNLIDLIPESFSRLSKLVDLDLSSNDLIGSIPFQCLTD